MNIKLNTKKIQRLRLRVDSRKQKHDLTNAPINDKLLTISLVGIFKYIIAHIYMRSVNVRLLIYLNIRII